MHMLYRKKHTDLRERLERESEGPYQCAGANRVNTSCIARQLTITLHCERPSRLNWGQKCHTKIHELLIRSFKDDLGKKWPAKIHEVLISPKGPLSHLWRLIKRHSGGRKKLVSVVPKKR